MQQQQTPTVPMPEDWHTVLAIVAHPDDMEYGAASAVAKWTAQGKRVVYLMVSRGEAGINEMHPSDVGRCAHRRRRLTPLGWLGWILWSSWTTRTV